MADLWGWPDPYTALELVRLRCEGWCRAHERPCFLDSHDDAKRPHRCRSCPGPAAKKMVRRAAR